MQEPHEEIAHREVFRGPTPREHRIAAALFVGFAVFFVLLYVVLSGWWFRWVILGLGVWSFVYGLRHWMDARAAARDGRH
ncbi:MAG: hypothetical protein QOF78_1462 [Phycisphaerales bacterium]|jgi:polyferredoxin|nr:hypothetical protein [Phycisphaerales bacterium]